MHEVYASSLRSLAPGVYSTQQVEAWVEGSAPESFRMPVDELCVALLETTVVGFSWLCPRSGWLRALYVRPRWFRHGVGSALLARCEAEARARPARGAEPARSRIVLLASLNAIGFYARRGFGILGGTQLAVGRDQRLEMMTMQKKLSESRVACR